MTTGLMRLMLISTVIFGVSGVLMGILNAQQHFFLPALAPVMYNLAIIGGAWFLGPSLGVTGLAFGVVMGAAGHRLVQLPAVLMGPYRIRYRPVLAARDPSVREVARLMGPRVLGLAAVQINFVVTAVLASGLSTGSITALNYGWMIMLLPQGIIAQSVATALFPTLAALASAGKVAEMRHIFLTTLRNLLFLTLPAAVGLIVLREPIVRLLLERGAFTPESTLATGIALGFFAAGLVAHTVVEIAARAFYALKNTKTPVIISIGAMVANIALSVALLRLFEALGWPPHGGLALANSAAVTLEMIAMLWLLDWPLGGLNQPGLRASLLKMGAATLGMALALLLIFPRLPFSDSGGGAGMGVLLGGLVYLAIAAGLRLDELAVLRRLLRR